MPWNMTEIPAQMASIIGTDTATAGVILSIFLTVVVLLALAYLGANSVTCAVGGIGMTLIFTALTWCPIWITVIISIIGAVLVASQISGRRRVEGAG